MNNRLLIVEDEPITRALLCKYFNNEGYEVHEAEAGTDVPDIVAEKSIDLILLDVNLPGKDGITLTRDLKYHMNDLGIILVTGNTDDLDLVVGLEVGADDYITKPFNNRVVHARVKNLLARINEIKALKQQLQEKSSQGQSRYRHFDDWQLDIEKRLLQQGDREPNQLTEGEFRLLLALMDSQGRVMSREHLLDMYLGRSADPSDRTIDVLIGRIRKKLGEPSGNPKTIITVHGSGYLFTAKVS